MTTISTRAGLQAPQLADTPANIESAVTPLRDRLESIMVMQRSVLAAQQVLEVGQLGQIRAGRPLTLADFTNMGLAAPLGLWSLSDVTDSSGNGRALVNKGAVPFAPGIMGLPGGAAQFAGSTAQALYIADTGAADPFRIKTGSWGCWFRTAKRGVTQYLVTKLHPTTGTLHSYYLAIGSNNLPTVAVYAADGSGSAGAATGITDVCDDRWHCAVATFDGTKVRLYADGALEGSATISTTLFSGAAPVNIGGQGADATTAALQPMYGRIDEAFITSDVLSDDQVRNLYCARIAHGLLNGAGAALAPTGVRLAVRRRRRGRALAVTDFPAQPARLYNLGGVADLGTNGVALAEGGFAYVAGPDGSVGTATHFQGGGGGSSATDAGLPAALAARSYGIWFKTTYTAAPTVALLGWGTISTGDARLAISANGVYAISGADSVGGGGVGDGLWHHAMAVEDNAAADGVKRKLYLDGRLITGSTVLNAITLAGANRFRIGANPDGTAPFTGQLSRAFVYAGALTPEQVRAIYNVGSMQLAASPKSEGDHVEAIDATSVLAVFDALEGTDLVDLAVVA